MKKDYILKACKNVYNTGCKYLKENIDFNRTNLYMITL